MISHEKRIIFVHLRRTGGNSVEVALGGIRLLDGRGEPTLVWDNRLHRGASPFKEDRRGHPIHATAEEIRRSYPREFEAYFRFSIVRNPWAQMASLYSRLFPQDLALAGFRRWLVGFRRPAGTVPQASLFDRRGRCLVDFVGRFESLADDFGSACDHAGIPRPTLPVTNRGGERDLSRLYDAATDRAVRKLFAADIERFGYVFQEPAVETANAARGAA